VDSPTSPKKLCGSAHPPAPIAIFGRGDGGFVVPSLLSSSTKRNAPVMTGTSSQPERCTQRAPTLRLRAVVA